MDKKPLFEGFADVHISRGEVDISPPKGVVIPPGYIYETEVFLPSRSFPSEKPLATYRVVEAPGWKNAWLRWWYPYEKPEETKT